MSAEQYANNAETTLVNAIDDDDTTLTVEEAELFPPTPQFRIRIDSELLLVTALSGMDNEIWTVERHVEQLPEAAVPHSAGATVTQVLTAGGLTNFAAANITSGQLALARGGTGADLSATGGTGHVVKQASAGANFTTGQVATADLADNAVSNAKLRDSVAVSVLGRSANSSGDPADIAAGANDRLLSRTGDALGFTQLTVGMLPNSVVTYAKIQDVSATDRLLGRATAGAGVIEEITCTAAGRALLDDANAAAQRATLDVPSNAEAILDTIIDAKGDLVVGTAADTPARLAVGSNGQVLTADSAEAAGMKWAVGGGGAPTDAEYLVGAASGGLSAERVVTDTTGTTGITWDLATGGQAKANATNAGKWVKLATATASASATVDFTLPAGYVAYKVVMSRVAPATDNTALWFRTSTDGGSTFDAGAGNYEWSGARTSTGVIGDNSTGDTKIIMSLDVTVGNSTQESVSGEVSVVLPSSTTTYTVILWTLQGVNLTPTFWWASAAGRRKATADVDAIRFLFSSGNVASGQFDLFGLAA